jgi:hypothetical protein
VWFGVRGELIIFFLSKCGCGQCVPNAYGSRVKGSRFVDNDRWWTKTSTYIVSGTHSPSRLLDSLLKPTPSPSAPNSSCSNLPGYIQLHPDPCLDTTALRSHKHNQLRSAHNDCFTSNSTADFRCIPEGRQQFLACNSEEPTSLRPYADAFHTRKVIFKWN